MLIFFSINPNVGTPVRNQKLGNHKAWREVAMMGWIAAVMQRTRMLRAEKLQITQNWGMDVGSACSGSGFLGVKIMRE